MHDVNAVIKLFSVDVLQNISKDLLKIQLHFLVRNDKQNYFINTSPLQSSYHIPINHMHLSSMVQFSKNHKSVDD